MESQMSGSVLEPAEIINETVEQAQQTNVSIMPRTGSGAEELSGRSGAVMEAKDFSTAIEHFSHLSSDLTEVLLDLSRIVRISEEQLKEIQYSVELKKGELKSLDAQIESERRAGEEERMRWVRQENEYAENLKTQRQHEEAEYRQALDSEKAKAQQQLKQELSLIEQENRLKHEAMERDFLQRETRGFRPPSRASNRRWKSGFPVLKRKKN